MTTQRPQILITLDDDLIKRIDDFRFSNRIGFRSEAIRQLIERGLQADISKNKSKRRV